LVVVLFTVVMVLFTVVMVLFTVVMVLFTEHLVSSNKNNNTTAHVHASHQVAPTVTTRLSLPLGSYTTSLRSHTGTLASVATDSTVLAVPTIPNSTSNPYG
jgi:hypothetical protein